MPNTDKQTVVALAVRDLIRGNLNNLKLRACWYGDQDKVPEVPGAAVEPGTKSRELAGVPMRTLNTFQIPIFIYHGKIQDVQENRLECDQRAEAVEELLHANVDLGGLVIAGAYVRQIESGFARRENGLFVASRLTWEAQTKRSITVEGA